MEYILMKVLSLISDYYGLNTIVYLTTYFPAKPYSSHSSLFLVMSVSAHDVCGISSPYITKEIKDWIRARMLTLRSPETSKTLSFSKEKGRAYLFLTRK